MNELMNIRKVSLQLGNALKVPHTVLEGIKSYNPKIRLIKVIEAFLEDHPRPNWISLVEALRSVQCSRLAGKLERKYCRAQEGKYNQPLKAALVL